MLFDFLLNPRLWLALARGEAEPVAEALRSAPKLPDAAQRASFLRNHDELDLSRLTKPQQQEVFRAFAPRADMRLFGRGIRRRLAPMLGGDLRRIKLAYSLQFTMPGTPVLRYGEEIGMGEDLSLRERDALRTPMQWDGSTGAGFTKAPPDRQVRPVRTRGPFSHRRVNVEAQQRDPESLLRWFELMLRTLRECPESGVGSASVVDVAAPPSVLVHRVEAARGAVVFLHNLADRAVTVDLREVPQRGDRPREVFSDAAYDELAPNLTGLRLNGYGYRWIRLRRSPGG
jgi:maltose alpha-D-glucosyltransferase/alpha-amylase